MPATLIVKREAVGLELRRAAFEIRLDGTNAGSISRHETFETPIQPGHHTLQLRAGRYTSPVQTFDAADGDLIGFRCHPPMMWPRLVASLIVPSLAISLKRDHSGDG
ncbi:MAG: hypothetical protein ACYCXW_14665 [Solirubrobacteraceae bacterium]